MARVTDGVMNAGEFYDDFKAALLYLGLRWGDMDAADVRIEGGQVRLSHQNRVAVIETPKKEDA